MSRDDAPTSAPAGNLPQDRRDQARAIAATVLDRRSRGEIVTDEQILGEHLSIFPELAQELEALRQILAATHAARQAGPAARPVSPLTLEELDQPIREGSHPTELPPLDVQRPVIAGYAITAEVGRGSQGHVFRAVDDATGRVVAVKVISGGAFLDSTHRTRFAREVRVLATLDHPHVVDVLDQGRTADGSFYFVMEYVDGQSFDDFATECAATDAHHPRLILTVLAKVARAVHAAHLKGVIHRDLKPSNIRVDRHGEPRILDFGLAQDDVDATTILTTSGQLVGSVPWLSPEQVSQERHHADARTDIYALGVIAYHSVTGQFPYAVNGPLKDVLERIASARPGRPSKLARRKIPSAAAVDAVLLRALSKSPGDRYASADAFAADLDCLTQGRPPTARLCHHRKAWLAVSGGILLSCSLFSAYLYRTEVPDVIALPRIQNSVGIELIRVPDGRFRMGSTRDDLGRDENEVPHEVVITRPFWIGATEVTAAQYASVMGLPAPAEKDALLPAVGVTWQDAVEFCRRLAQREGRAYRLPTEAEWEYACRAAKNVRAKERAGHAWFDENSGGRVRQVGGKKPNQWGLYDTLGNAAELCLDGYQPLGLEQVVDPLGPEPAPDGPPAVLRGGHFNSPPINCRAAYRTQVDIANPLNTVGFRVVQAPQLSRTLPE